MLSKSPKFTLVVCVLLAGTASQTISAQQTSTQSGTALQARTSAPQDATLVRSGRVSIPELGSQSPAADASASGPDATDKTRFPALSLPLQASSEGADANSLTAGAGWFDGSLMTVAGALGITLGLFCCFVAVMRRTENRGLTRSLPKQALEVVGHVTIGPRQKLVVVRCANSALVLGVSPAGIQTVAEFDEAKSAHAFIASCRGNGSAGTFRSTLRDLEREPHANQFVDAPAAKNTKRGERLFVRA